MNQKQNNLNLALLNAEQKENLPKYKFLRDSYSGKGGYGATIPGFKYDHKTQYYLDQYPAELTQDYYDRLKTSHYVNYSAPVVDLYSNFLFRRPIIRSSKNPILNDYLNSSNYAEIIKSAQNHAAITGTCFILVEIPELDSSIKNYADAIKNNWKGVELSIIPIERIINWGIDDDDELSWIRFKTIKTESTPFSTTKIREIFTTYTKSEYFVHELIKDSKTYKLIASGSHSFSQIPLIKIVHKEDSESILGESQLIPIAALNRAHYNRNSELTSLLRGQAFSQLIMPMDLSRNSAEQQNVEIGISRMIMVSPDANIKPEYISPSAQNAATLEIQISHLAEEIMREGNLEWLRTMLTGRTNANLSSGVARKQSFAQCNALLKAMAIKLQESEKQLLKLICEALNIEPEFEINYPKDFELDSLNSDFNDLFQAIISKMPTNIINKMKINLSRELVGGLTNKELNEAEKELLMNSSNGENPLNILEQIPTLPNNNQQ